MFPDMKRKWSVFISVIILLSIAGCIKETYDIDKLSKEGHLKPGFGVSVVHGKITLSDIVEKNDTIIIDNDTVFINDDDVVTFIYRKDSVISFNIDDYFDFSNMISYSDIFILGELSLGSFTDTMGISLNEISLKFPTASRAILVALNGTTGDFPPFPAITLDNKAFSPFDNFESASFSSGILKITVTNNLTIPLNDLNIQLYDSAGLTAIGDPFTFALINPGQSLSDSLDLKDLVISNSIIAAVGIGANDGENNVLIDLDNSSLDIAISGENLKIKSGRVVLPLQIVQLSNNRDTVSFDPGEDIQIDEIRVLSGNINYSINTMFPVKAYLTITLPTVTRDSNPVSETVSVEPGPPINDKISLDNSLIDLGTSSNLMPVNYSLEVSSDNNMIDFDSEDQLGIELSFTDTENDYVKGYLGQHGDTIKSDTLDLGIEDILSNISGSYLISSPSVKLNYSNSFSIPVRIDLDAVGYNMDDSVDIDLDPVPLSYPAAPSERDKDGVYTIDKDNSNFPELISMLPEKIRFGGSVVMNPDGDTGARDNYIFSNSRFLGNLEIEVPVELRLNDLQFADTVDNPIKKEDFSDSPLDPEDIEKFKILLDIENSFPLGISLSVSLYDSVSNTVLSEIKDVEILEPAPVGSDGRTEPLQYKTEIEITRDFWNSIYDADKLIFSITLVTTDGDTRDVKIYSDYYFDYKAALFIKPDLKFSFE
jgi:hypothetical protein